MGSAAKVAAALRLSEDDAAAINALKAEIEKAWRLVDASAEKARPQPSQGHWLRVQSPGDVFTQYPHSGDQSRCRVLHDAVRVCKGLVQLAACLQDGDPCGMRWCLRPQTPAAMPGIQSHGQ